jgi:hypothetical protein
MNSTASSFIARGRTVARGFVQHQDAGQRPSGRREEQVADEVPAVALDHDAGRFGRGVLPVCRPGLQEQDAEAEEQRAEAVRVHRSGLRSNTIRGSAAHPS